jgi:plasmid stabilization system protein ParE
MACRVIVTPRASADLREIVRFIRRDNPQRAQTFADELIRNARALGEWPEMGRIVPELKDPAVRETVHGSYRIIYEVLGDPPVVYILRFWHAARGTPEKGR